MPIQLVAHRGAAAGYPENSLAALQAAVDCGVRRLEFDVQLSADRVAVLSHDADLRRTGGHAVSVLECPYARLREYGVGEPERFGERFAGLQLVRLEEVVDWLRDQPGVTAFVELKTESLQHFGLQLVLDAVAGVLSPVRGQVVLISYAGEVARQARALGCAGGGWVLAGYSEAAHTLARELQPDFLICNQRRLPPATEALWPGPWQWMSYEVTSMEQLRGLQRRGVAYAESRDCCALRHRLEGADARL